MKFKTVLMAAAALAATVLAVLLWPRKSFPRPNVVLVVIDTLRADRLRFYGYPKETAPFLSKLAAHGVVFEKAYSASSWTAPATASILTGLYPFQHGVVVGLQAQKRLIRKQPHIRINRIPEIVTTLPEVFRQGGYRTFGFADNCNITDQQGFDQGFDRLNSFIHKGGRFLNQQVLDLKGEILAGSPYFLYLHYNDVHRPYKIRLDESQKTGDRTTNMKMIYDREIDLVDSCLEKLYAELGWAQNTLVIVTADHGEEQNERGFYGHGRTLFNTVIHVPFVLFWPEQKLFSAKRISQNVSTIDILPTLDSLLGFNPVKELAGHSLVPLLKRAGRALAERYVYSHLHHKEDAPKSSVHEASIHGDFKS